MIESGYAAAMGAVRFLASGVRPGPAKYARVVVGRRTSPARLIAWSRAERTPGAGCLWLHGASAGELLATEPVLAALRQRWRFQLIVTYASPSAATAARRLKPSVADFLPLDAPDEMRRTVSALRPDVIVFAKHDVWPMLTRVAAAAGVPLGLINGTVRPGSSRLRAPSRALLRPAYRRLAAVGAASPEDGQRLCRLGVRPSVLRFTGDAAFDRALAAAERPAAEVIERLPKSSGGPPRLVAGSTWPADDEVLLTAIAELERAGHVLELVLVPHEPGPAAVRRLRGRCLQLLGREARVWSEESAGAIRSTARDGAEAGSVARGVTGTGTAGAANPAPPPLILDATGLLAGLYSRGDLAYVGGGFGRGGLHSVIEPAAAGVPVLFGPCHDRREAAGLLARGGAVEVGRHARTAVEALLIDSARRRAMGRAALAYVCAEAGAAEAGARLIAGLIVAPRR